MKIKFFDAEKFYTEYTLTDDERDAAREFTGSFCGDEEGGIWGERKNDLSMPR